MKAPNKVSLTTTTLDQIPKGDGGWVTSLQGPEPTLRRLMEMGLVEEAYVEMIHEAPFGGDPVAIKVRGGLLALRRKEAQMVSIRKAPPQ